jgi:flagellar assembly protein FliH
MTRDVRTYQYQDLNQKSGSSSGPEIRTYQEPKFEAHTNAKKIDDIHKKKTDGFQLDGMVVSQLGMDERQRQEHETRIRKEIERRWEQSAEKAEVSGYTKGLEEGKAEAYKAEQPRIRERLEKLDHLLQSFDSYREKIFGANEAFLMDLIAEVAGMIVLKEVEVDRDYIRRLVTTLLQQLGTKDDIKIYLSEADFANVEGLRQAIEKDFGKLNNSSIEVSSEIPVGGCKIETRFGVVDASIAAQIANTKSALKG